MAGYFPDLLEQYKQLLKQMRADGVTSGDLYSEVKQAIEWMETGYDPAEYRAATRVDAFSMDPYHMQQYMTYANSEYGMTECMLNLQLYIRSHSDEVRFKADWKKAESRKEKINDMLKGLTDDEKAVFISIRAENMPFSQVAKMMGVTRGTVQTYLRRAEQKIERNKNRGVQADLFDIA